MHVFALVICVDGASAETILFNGVRREKEELSEWPGDKKNGRASLQLSNHYRSDVPPNMP